MDSSQSDTEIREEKVSRVTEGPRVSLPWPVLAAPFRFIIIIIYFQIHKETLYGNKHNETRSELAAAAAAHDQN